MMLRDWDLRFDADAVLRAQGADPSVLRRRRSSAVEVAEEAVERGSRLIRPAAVYATLRVADFSHGRLRLDGGARLSGPLISDRLSAAAYVVAAVCTVGPDVEGEASNCAVCDPALSVALDGLGSAAIQSLSNAMKTRIREEVATTMGLLSTGAISPGYDGWPVKVGQLQLFALVDAEAIGVRLTDGMMMVPHKSASFVIGFGANEVAEGRPCDFCAVADRCRFREAGGHGTTSEHCHA